MAQIVVVRVQLKAQLGFYVLLLVSCSRTETGEGSVGVSLLLDLGVLCSLHGFWPAPSMIMMIPSFSKQTAY